jgi:O-antigen ligase
MNFNNKSSLQTILLSEIILVLAMIAGIVPREFSYLILVLLIISFIKLSFLDSLKLFILSIPFFTALPANAFSDSMSAWRVLIVVLFLKMVYEKYGLYLKNCHSELVSESTNFKGLTILQFIRQNIMRIGGNDGNIQKILKQVQDDNYYKLFLLTVLFFAIAILSLISAESPGAGVKKMLFLANIFLLFPIVIYSIKKESDLIKILKAVFCSAVIIVSIGYFQFLSTFIITLSQFWDFWTNNVIRVFYGQNLSQLLSYSNTWFSYYDVLPPTLRMFSVMPDSHSFAMLIIISMPVVLSLLFFYKKEKQKKYLSVALIFFLLAVYFSGSRGAWVGSVFALMAGVYLFITSSEKEKNSSKLKKICFIILEFIKLLKSKVGLKFNEENNSKYLAKLIAFSVILFFVLMPVSSLVLRQNQETQIIKSDINLSAEERGKFSMFERAFSISDFSETSNIGRLQIWQETLFSIGNRPFLGVGFGNFNYVLDQSESALKKGSSAHSIYLDIASEIGIYGLMIFLFLLAFILECSYNLFFKLRKIYLKIFAGSFFVYFFWICAYSIFDVVIFNDKVLIMIVIMIGLLYSLQRADQEM